MSSGQDPPDRVRVTNPRASGAPSRRRSVSSEIDAQTGLGEVYIRSLMRSQLRLAALVLTVLGLTLGMLPVIFVLFPSTRSAAVLGIPVPWLLLGFLVYPVLLALGWFYVRHAERNERDFSDLVGPR